MLATRRGHQSETDVDDQVIIGGSLENGKQGSTTIPSFSATPTINDPYSFSEGKKSTSELDEIRKRKRGKKLVSHYKAQNEVLFVYCL